MNPRDPSEIVNNVIPNPHPCSINPNSINDSEKDYENLSNCCQRHVCRTLGYCKSNTVNGCRFRYPFELNEKTRIDFIETGKSVKAEIILKRNNKFMNVHNRVIIQI